jgi:hypothetical protein
LETLEDDSKREEFGMIMRCIAWFGKKIILAIKVAEGQEVATHKANNHVVQ